MKEIIAQYLLEKNVSAKKSLGQNFLTDENIISKIVHLARNHDSYSLCEIGPGLCSLTRYLVKLSSIDIIEIDNYIANIIPKILHEHSGDYVLHLADAIHFDFTQLSQLRGKKLAIISNLPYNVGTKIITNILSQHKNTLGFMVCMVQKEVADRILAKHSSKDYGSLSIFCQLNADIEKCFDVAPGCFHPKPRIDSTIIKITPKYDLDPELMHVLTSITKIFFQFRRKKLPTIVKNYAKNIIIPPSHNDLRPEEIFNSRICPTGDIEY